MGEVPAPAIVPVPTEALEKRKLADAVLDQLTDELLEESLGTIHGALQFAKIDPEATEPPPEWVERLGEQKAKEQLVLARYGLMKSADAPVGLKLATQVATGILKSRGERKAPSSLNVQFVNFQFPQVQYPSRKVER